MNINEITVWFMAHGGTILSIVAHACLAASAIVKLTPTLKDDNLLLPIIKFLGKWIAWDKYGKPK